MDGVAQGNKTANYSITLVGLGHRRTATAADLAAKLLFVNEGSKRLASKYQVQRPAPTTWLEVNMLPT